MESYAAEKARFASRLHYFLLKLSVDCCNCSCLSFIKFLWIIQMCGVCKMYTPILRNAACKFNFLIMCVFYSLLKLLSKTFSCVLSIIINHLKYYFWVFKKIWRNLVHFNVPFFHQTDLMYYTALYNILFIFLDNIIITIALLYYHHNNA